MSANLEIILIYLILALLFIGIGFWGAILMFHFSSNQFRKKNHIPNILGQWRCQWFDDKGNKETPKVEDIMEITKWIRDGKFAAIGHQPQYRINYPIRGEIDPSGSISLEYRAENFPFESNRGLAFMQISRDRKVIEGHWFGKRSNGVLGGGKVVCYRVSSKVQ